MEPQQADHLPGDLLPRFIAPQQHNPVLRNAEILPATSRVQLEGQWEDVVPPAVRVHGAVQENQDTPQDRQYLNVANHHLVDYREIRDEHVVPYIYPNIGLAQDFRPDPPQDHQGNHRVGYAPRGIVPGPTQSAFPDPSTHYPHALGQPVVENLRRLASRYVHHPDSKVDMVQMEPGTAGRYKVVIVLEMSDFL